MSDIAIIKKENVELIIQSAPQAYQENQVSHDRCMDAGRQLYTLIERQGMTDELYQKAALYIERSRKTVRKMNEKRSPVTKLFDEIRKVYTVMETDIDPLKQGTLPYLIQQKCNEYAGKKRAEEEERRQEELLKQQRKAAIDRYMADVEADFRRQFNLYLTTELNELTRLNGQLTLGNFDVVSERIKTYPIELPDGWTLMSQVPMPTQTGLQEAKVLRNDILNHLLADFKGQYHFEMESNRNAIVDMLPSKKRELEAIDKAGAEEAAKREAEMKAREAEEAARREDEQRAKEEAERQSMELKRKNAEIADIFSEAAASVQTYQSKIAVKKRLVPLNTEAFMPIISMWWTQEGCTMTVEELSKTLKKQLAFCEKLANDKSNPVFIESEHISYEDEVKARLLI